MKELNKKRAAAGIGGAFLAVGLVYSVWCTGKILSHFHDTGRPGLDVLIVLGANVKKSGPSKVLSYRLDEAADYLLENPETVCIVTGGQGTNEPCTEAEAMADYLTTKGIGRDRIIKEEQATNTAENIRFSRDLFDGGRVGILTSDYHLSRSLAIARKQGLKDVCGIAARTKPIYLPLNFTREILAVGKNLICGNM